METQQGALRDLRGKKYILFDLDGTIVDSFPGIAHSVTHTLKRMGEPVPEYETMTRFVGPPLKQSFEKFCGFDSRVADEAVRIYREHYGVAGVFELAPYPGVLELIRALVQRGKSVLLATAKPTVVAAQILERLEVADCFAFLSGSELDGRRCGKDESILYAMEHCSIADKSGVVMIGDREYDAAGAKKAGVDFIGVLYGYGMREELLEAGAREEWLAGSVADLASMLL